MKLSVSDIKYKTREVLINSRKKMTVVFIVIGVIGVVTSYIDVLIGGSIGLIVNLVVMVLTLPLGHGYIVTSLKAVNNQEEQISTKEDSLVGFTRFKQLFSTYFIHGFFIFMIDVVILVVGLVIFFLSVPNFTDLIDRLASDFQLYGDFTVANAEMMVNAIMPALGILFLISIAIIVVSIMYSLIFGLTPYILEKYDIRGVKAMSESARLMKGYKGTLFVLMLSFIGWIFLYGIIWGIIMLILPFPLVYNIIGIVLSVYIYQVNLQTCLAVLYEEIDIDDKNNICENNDNNI